ncbi:MAG: chalcone isomerase family protein [Deltaproteobacteria bacterium]|nr:chalcone isomerase family protein [Deltaproteobacteria bacterium]
MYRRLCWVLLSVFMMTSVSAAKEIGGVNLPDSMMAGDAQLALNGAGLRKKVFIKVYSGALYLKQANSDARAIIDADEPMAIRMHFIYDGVSAEKLVESWN